MIATKQSASFQYVSARLHSESPEDAKLRVSRLAFAQYEG